MKKPFKVGEKVTSKFNSGEEDIVRTITKCERDDSCGSKFRASANGGEPCKCCGKIIGNSIIDVDSLWFKLHNE